MSTGKIDIKKTYKELYTAPVDIPKFVDVPAFTYITVQGEGNPNGNPAYEAAVQALYTVAYGVKFAAKASELDDYVVAPLSGFWEMASGPPAKNADGSWAWDWQRVLWKAAILQPAVVSTGMIEEVVATTKEKKQLPALDKLQISVIEEGHVAQIMHVGPYANEAPTITKLHDFIEENGYQPHLTHHEIYLSDPRRCAPEKLKTILRQPVKLKA